MNSTNLIDETIEMMIRKNTGNNSIFLIKY